MASLWQVVSRAFVGDTATGARGMTGGFVGEARSACGGDGSRGAGRREDDEAPRRGAYPSAAYEGSSSRASAADGVGSERSPGMDS